MAASSTYYPNNSSDKLFRLSGYVATTTVKTSLAVTSVDNNPSGLQTDGTDVTWCGNGGDKIYIQSGDLTSTLKHSQSVVSIDNAVGDVSTSEDGYTPWCGFTADKVYVQSGEGTGVNSTLKDSLGGLINPYGCSVDDADTYSTGSGTTAQTRLLRTSGRGTGMTATVKSSLGAYSVDTVPNGICFDGTDTEWSGSAGDKVYLQSGQFTSTMKTSISLGANVSGCSHDDNASRLGLTPGTSNPKGPLGMPLRGVFGGPI